jgi:CheY-like chemotaxis protein
MDPARRILVVEDILEDFELISHELDKEGQRFTIRRIESPERLAEELDRQPPDVVLCDHGGAQWDSFAVLAQVRARSAELPFIIVTGDMQHAAVTRALAGGADDLVLKHQLGNLGPAIRRALRLTREIQLRRKAEAERDRLRRELTARWTRPQASRVVVRICAGCKKIPDEGGEWIQLERYFHKQMAIEFTHGLCPVCVQQYTSDMR